MSITSWPEAASPLSFVHGSFGQSHRELVTNTGGAQHLRSPTYVPCSERGERAAGVFGVGWKRLEAGRVSIPPHGSSVLPRFLLASSPARQLSSPACQRSNTACQKKKFPAKNNFHTSFPKTLRLKIESTCFLSARLCIMYHNTYGTTCRAAVSYVVRL